MPTCVVGKCCMRSSRKTQYQVNVEKTSKVTFHKFPKDPTMRAIWIKSLNLKELTDHATVCSLHFPSDAFRNTQLNTVQLKNTAVPCISHVKINPEQNEDMASHFETCEPSTSAGTVLPDLTLNVQSEPQLERGKIDVGKQFAKKIILSPVSAVFVPVEECSQTTTKNSQMLISPDLAGCETDPLTVAPTDNLFLFGDQGDNIEFVIEDDDCIIETKSNSGHAEIIDLEGTNIEPCTTNEDVVNVTVSSTETEESQMDVDLSSSALEEIKDEIEVEEPHIQFLHGQKTGEISEVPTAYEKIVDTYEDGIPEDSVCYVPECTVNSQNKVYRFDVPTDENLKKIWDICIDRKDRRLSNQDVICRKHFSGDDIMIMEFTASSKDKATVAYSKPTLRQGAVPCIKFYEECCVPTCRRISGRMYSFPVVRTSDFHLWLYMIKNPNLKNLKMKDVLKHRVCEVHFEPDCFDEKFLLRRIAAPTLNLPENYTPDLTSAKCTAPSELVDTTAKNIYLECAHRECGNTANIGKNFFKFPTDADRCIAWLKACGRENMITTPFTTVQRVRAQTLAVCEDHFEFHHFSTTMDKLEFSAVPKPCTVPSVDFRATSKGPNIIRKPVVKDVYQGAKSSTPYSAFNGTCFYKGCNSKPSGDNKFFSFPTLTHRYELWLKACGRLNLSAELKNKISKNQRICSKHFKEEMFESENKLKNDAIPVIYENTSDSPDATEDGFTAADDVDANQKSESPRVQCAVQNCLSYSKMSRGKGIYHKFPNPSTDSERFNMWLLLIANKKVAEHSDGEIYKKYVVCGKHFESRFYEDGAQLRLLNQEAVPTVNLTADIKWFFDSEYYKTRVENDIDNTPENGVAEDTIEWRKDNVIDIDSCDDRTKCILEGDRIRFPAMGHYLYLGKRKHPSNRRFPYGVYKRFKSGYGLNSDVKIGENIRIHTAIIIDDDDDCERAVLQQLLDKRKKL